MGAPAIPRNVSSVHRAVCSLQTGRHRQDIAVARKTFITRRVKSPHTDERKLKRRFVRISRVFCLCQYMSQCPGNGNTHVNSQTTFPHSNSCIYITYAARKRNFMGFHVSAFKVSDLVEIKGVSRASELRARRKPST